MNVDEESLLRSTCTSHSGNRFLISIASEDLQNDTRDIVNVFHEPKMESLLLRFGGTKLKNYPDTRFCFDRNTIESILKNYKIMRDILMIEDVTCNERIFELIFDDEFIRKFGKAYNDLTPICKLIHYSQSFKINIADATEKWLSLTLPTNEYDLTLAERIKKAIHPVGYADNLSHNKYTGILLNNNQL